jgi:hypothetical protein
MILCDDCWGFYLAETAGSYVAYCILVQLLVEILRSKCLS